MWPTWSWLADSRDRCGASGAQLKLEYRSKEVLAVSAVDVFGRAERCYAEALWSLRLDESPDVTPAAYASMGSVTVRLPEGEAALP